MNSRCSIKVIASLGSKRKIFFNCSQNSIRNQEIFTVLLVAIAVDSFCSFFCNQEKPKRPSYIFLCITNVSG